MRCGERSPPAASSPFGRRSALPTGGKSWSPESQVGKDPRVSLAPQPRGGGARACTRPHAARRSEPLVGALADQSAGHASAGVAGGLRGEVVGLLVDDDRTADDAAL